MKCKNRNCEAPVVGIEGLEVVDGLCRNCSPPPVCGGCGQPGRLLNLNDTVRRWGRNYHPECAPSGSIFEKDPTLFRAEITITGPKGVIFRNRRIFLNEERFLSWYEDYEASFYALGEKDTGLCEMSWVRI